MKILFIRNTQYLADYLTDSIYHGLISLGHEVYVNGTVDHMYKYYEDDNDLIRNKFTLYTNLEGEPNYIGLELIDLIYSRFFNKIIISDIRSYNSYLNDYNLIFKQYRTEDIHLIDGHDDPFILDGIQNYGTLWKRELVNGRANAISFGLPKEKLIDHNPDKTKLFGTVVPGDMNTYIYNDEASYYQDYASSYYGKTWKKGGWDCLRHYEILANKCIPFFPDIKECPKNTMVDFPKKLIIESNKWSSKNKIHPDYDDLNNQLFEWTKNKLTTESVAQKILNY